MPAPDLLTLDDGEPTPGELLAAVFALARQRARERRAQAAEPAQHQQADRPAPEPDHAPPAP
jgi:hypothetical protein